jgi:hypothetical protein
MNPRARADGILSKAIDGELILYDEERHRAHRLNATAAAVWQHCDGRRTTDEIARLLSSETGKPISDEVVRLVLAELGEANLLCDHSAEGSTVTRRAALHRLAAAGLVLLPVVTTITAPTPADAQSHTRGGRKPPKPRKPRKPRKP